MHPPLEEWDAQYLHSIAAPGETAGLEKKASPKFDPINKKTDTRECLAKQVCAFANAGGGFLVFGINDTGGLDAGVSGMVERESVKAWVEKVIPTLLHPPVNNCQAALIQDTAHHATGRGVLVIEIPASDDRPHWIPGKTDVAYIRAGEHSSPMKHQTLLDISNRGNVPRGSVESIGTGEQLSRTEGTLLIRLRPVVLLLGGPHCKAGEWAVSLEFPLNLGGFRTLAADPDMLIEGPLIFIQGTTVLFPGRRTQLPAFQLAVKDSLDSLNHAVTAILFAGSAQPAKRNFLIRDLMPRN